MPAVDLPNGQRIAYSLLGCTSAAAGGGGEAAPPSQQRLLIVSGLAIPRSAVYVRLLAEHLSTLTGPNGRRLVTVCTYDLRGLGGSSAPRRLRAYTTEAMAEDALLLLDHLGWQTGVHLLASSLGGQISCKMAARQPDRFASLLLVGTAQGWQLDLITALRRPLAPTRLEVMLRHSRDPGRPNLLQDCAMHSTARLGQALACVRHWLSTSDAEAIRCSGMPVHALTGSHDGITAASAVAVLAGSLGAQSMHSVHGGHAGIMVEHAVPVLAAVEQAILGRVVSSPAQRRQAQQAAEAALMRSNFAFWEHILLHWLWAAVLECVARLMEACWVAVFWAVLQWRILRGSSHAVHATAAGKAQVGRAAAQAEQ